MLTQTLHHREMCAALPPHEHIRAWLAHSCGVVMDIVSIVGQIAKVLGYFGGGALVGGWLYTTWRTGSLHLLRRRIWKLLHGSEPVNDPEIQGLIDDRTKLMAFSYETGFVPRSLGRAKLMAKWLKDNDEDFNSIKAVGPFFDRDQVCMVPKLPPRSRLYGYLVLIFVASMFIMVGLGIAVSSRGYFTVTATGDQFSASASEVRGIKWPWSKSFDAQVLSVEMCKSNKFPASAFVSPDREVLCQFLLDPSAEARVAKAVLEQRVGMGALGSFAGILLGLVMLRVRQLERAWGVERRIRERAAQKCLPVSGDASS